MKKITFTLLLLLFSISVNAQDSVPTTQPVQQTDKYMYCQIVGTAKLFSSKVTVEIDFGQAKGFWSDNRLRGEDGKPIVFNSMVDAMNWMGNDGWEFMQAYVVTLGSGTGSQNVYHWLLKKNVDKLTAEEKADLLSKMKTKKDFK